MKSSVKDSQLGVQLNAACVEASSLLKSLSNPQRLKILCELIQGRSSVQKLQESCEISQSLVSQFLSRMKREGLIDSQKEGKYVFYEIVDQKVLQLIQSLHTIFCKEETKK